jgi:hypothetical protein
VRYVEVDYIALVPLIAGIAAVLVAGTRKANTFSPILALGVMLITSGIVIGAGTIILSVLSLARAF